MKLVFSNDEFNNVHHFAKKPFVQTIHLKNCIFYMFLQVNINKFPICLWKLYIQTQITNKMKSWLLHKKKSHYFQTLRGQKKTRKTLVQEEFLKFENSSRTAFRRKTNLQLHEICHALEAKFVSCGFLGDLPIRKTDCARSFGSNERAYSNPQEKYFAPPRISASVVKRYIVRNCIRGENERSVLFCSAWNFSQTFAFVFL